MLWKAVLYYCGGRHLENFLLTFFVTSKWVLNWQICPCINNSCVTQVLISTVMPTLHLCSLCEYFLSQDTGGMYVLCKLWLRKRVCMLEELGTALSIQCVGSSSGWTSQTPSQAKLAGSFYVGVSLYTWGECLEYVAFLVIFDFCGVVPTLRVVYTLVLSR